MKTIQKFAITFSVLLYAVVVPILEINETHVFNPDWTPHAKIHEVWQLITNSSIGLFCLYLLWIKNEINLSALLSLLVMGGFLVAFFIKDSYGGSMKFLDGTEKTIMGVNVGLLGFGIAFLLIVITLILGKSKQNAN